MTAAQASLAATSAVHSGKDWPCVKAAYSAVTRSMTFMLEEVDDAGGVEMCCREPNF
jgi:hypothetical protein